MKYTLHITAAAEDDLRGAADYIEYVLMNPQASAELVEAAAEVLTALTEHPERRALPSDPVLRAWGVRFVRVKNYLAFYTVDEAAERVNIIRFLYAKRNWMDILRGGFSVD